MGALQSRQMRPTRVAGNRLSRNDARRIRARFSQGTGRPPRTLYLRAGKRCFDMLGAAVGLTILSPLLLLCAAAIWIDSRSPIFYRQIRVGLNGAPFRIFKLRTMSPGADRQGSRLTASGDGRITRIGRILRKTKLDEIPQLLNVLAGHMSLVGPRPEVPEYTAHYTPDEKKVLDVKPGMTGLASLAYIDEERLLATCSDKESFYINTVMKRKLATDLAYLEKLNFREDLAIVFLTATAVLSRRRSGGQAAGDMERNLEAGADRSSAEAA